MDIISLQIVSSVLSLQIPSNYVISLQIVSSVLSLQIPSNYVIPEKNSVSVYSLYSLAWHGKTKVSKLSFSEFSQFTNLKIHNSFMRTIIMIVCKDYLCVTWLTSLTTHIMKDGRVLVLIFMDPCIVDYSVEIPTRCVFVIEFIIPKFIEDLTCFERHTAHHQEL